MACCRAGVAVCLALLLAQGLVWAQEPAKLNDEDLLKRASSEASAFAKLEEALDGLKVQVSSNAQALEKVREVLEAPPPALPTSPARLAPFDAAAIEVLIERQRQYQAAAQARRNAVEQARELLDERRKLLAGAAASQKALVQAATSARDALAELARRVEAGTIRGEDARIDEKTPSVDAWIVRVDEGQKIAPALLAAYEREGKEVVDEQQSLQGVETVAPETEREVRRRMEAMDLLLEASRLEGAEREEQARLDAAALSTLLTRLDADRRTEVVALDDVERRADALRIALLAIEDTLANLESPTKDAIPEGEGHPELRQVRRDAALSDALLAHHQSRLDLLADALRAIEALRGGLADEGGAFDRGFRVTTRLAAAVALADEARVKGGPAVAGLPADATRVRLWENLRRLAAAEGRRRVDVADIEARRKDETAVEGAKKDLAAEQAVNARLRDQLREEESYAQFLEEMAGRTEAELIALLVPEGDLASNLRARVADVDAAEKQAQEAEQKARSVRETIRTIENPYVQVGLARAGTRAQEIQKELERSRDAKDGQLPSDTSARPLGIGLEEDAPPGPNGAAPPAASQETPDAALSEKARLEQEQTFARELLRYFTDLETNLDRWDAALKVVESTGLAFAARLSDVINEEKRRYACARELERRYERGRIARSRLPSDLTKLLSREAILAAQKRRDDFLRNQEVSRARRDQELQGLRAIASLRVWAERLASSADRKTILIGQPVAHLAAARAEFDALPEVRQQAIVYQAEVKRSAEDDLLDWVLSKFMDSKSRERFEKPLQVYYLESVDRARALAEFESAAGAYEEMVEAANVERDALAPAPAALREATAQRLFNYQVARHLAAIAAAPDRQASIETAFRAAYKKDLPLPSDAREWSVPYWADQLFAVELRLWAHLKWIAEFERKLSKLGLEADIGRYRKGLAKISGEIQVQRSTVDRLLSDIAAVRADYRSRARRETIWAFAQVLIIPLVAWGALRVLRRVGRRLEKAARRGSKGETSERVRRIGTLTKVSGTAISTAVWIITAIYLLGQLGVNITPILASAGVLGLAIAFGAQTMIKDFLSGFFILLENQYRIGDVITLEGVGGVVERITLRTTVLRDLEGTVHYIPNGTLARVSNRTQGWSRVVLDVGVAYKEQLDRVIAVLENVLLKMCADDRWGPSVLEREVCGVEALGDSSVSVRVLVKTPPMKQWEVARELRKRIKDRFDAEGIEIPFPQRVIHQIPGTPPAAAAE